MSTIKSEAVLAFRVILAALAIAGIIFAYHWAADKFRAPPIATTTQRSATTPGGVQQAAAQCKIPVSSQGHSKEISDAVQAKSERNPDSIMQTTGSEWERAVERKRIETQSDFVMVTDPKRPADRPVIKPGDQVTVNAYYVKAFPRHFEQIGYGPPATVLAAASWKIAKTKTKEWYVGAWGMADMRTPAQSRAGIMFTRM